MFSKLLRHVFIAMTNIILRRTATLAAAFCAALALSTPAFAQDVQIQEGAAVKFPKGLKWEPMAISAVGYFPSEKENIAWGTASPKEWNLAASQWKKEIPAGEQAIIVSKIKKSDKENYFISSGYAVTGIKCKDIILDNGDSLLTCRAKVMISDTPSFQSTTTIDVGAICAGTLDSNFEGGLFDTPIKQTKVYPEIAFDSKNRVIYTRQKTHDGYPQQCNRKITLTPGDKTSGGAAQNAATPAPASQSQSGTAIAGDMTPRRALEALYGSVSTANTPDRDCKEYASWKPPLNTEKFKNYFSMGAQYKNQPLLVCSKFSASYTEQDKQKFVLVTRAGIRDAFDTVNFSTTDVPPPIIGMAVFVKDGGQWRLEAEDRFAAYTGFSETMKLQKVGANKYGVLLTDVSHYGAGCDNVEVKLLMPHAGGVTAHELNVPLTEKEEMSFSECKATSVSFDTKSRDEHYPVTVKQTFTDERGRNLKKSARLTFSNGSYVKSK